jgi:hypothetical protein
METNQSGAAACGQYLASGCSKSESDTPRTDKWLRVCIQEHSMVICARAFERELAVARKGLDAVASLIAESHGVGGLHLNGDYATWDELRTGGRFEGWLADFDAALVAVHTLNPGGLGTSAMNRTQKQAEHHAEG